MLQMMTPVCTPGRPRRLVEAGQHRVQDLRHGVSLEFVEDRREPHLDVAHVFAGGVLHQLARHAPHRFRLLQHGKRVLERVQVLLQRLAGVAAHEAPAQLRLGGAGQVEVLVAGQLAHGVEADRAVEMNVQVGLGDLPQEARVGEEHGGLPAPLSGTAPPRSRRAH